MTNSIIEDSTFGLECMKKEIILGNNEQQIYRISMINDTIILICIIGVLYGLIIGSILCAVKGCHTLEWLLFQVPVDLNIKTAVSESVRQNIHLIENDLILSESSLIDELQIKEYISEEDAKTLKDRNRTDQAHIFAQMLEVMDDESFLDVVRILKECSFDHIASELERYYNVSDVKAKISSEKQYSICPTCRLKREVDIKEMRSDLKKEDFLSYKLYRDINKMLFS